MLTPSQSKAKQYIKEMAELSKRIQAAHSQHHGIHSSHHSHQQQQQTVESYKEIPSSIDEKSANLPKPLSVVNH